MFTLKPNCSIMIDLHGCSVQQSREILAKHFASAQEKNIKELYIITGRGNHKNPDGSKGILKKVLPKLLKPYCELIELVDPEIGSYKIILKQAALQNTLFLQTILHSLLGDEASNHQHYVNRLEQAIKQDDVSALIILGSLYLFEGIQNHHDKDKGIAYLEKAYQLGSLEAGIILGQLHLEGIEVKKTIRRL